MRVLVTGATGLIGSHVLQALRAAGVSAAGASRRRPAGELPQDWLALDFGSMTASGQWLPLLQGYDAVVNSIGIIRERCQDEFDRLHRAAPVALFAACEQLGLRVIQVSALGSHPQAATAYWRSKGAADTDLLARQIDATVVRPSLVYGQNGASSMLFRTLATLPLLLLPAAHRARVQPVHVADLAAIVVGLLTRRTNPAALGDARLPATPASPAPFAAPAELAMLATAVSPVVTSSSTAAPAEPGTRAIPIAPSATPHSPAMAAEPAMPGTPAAPAPLAATATPVAPEMLPRELAVVGPRAMTLADYLGDLRRGMRAPAALVWSLPSPVARLAAHLAALSPSAALTPASLLMLEQSVDGSNTADPAPAQALLGRPLRDPAGFAGPADRLAASWSWGAPLLTITIALMWLITAWVSWFGWPHAESRSWLAACGVPTALQEPMLLAASLTDAAIGALLLWRPRRWLWAAQLVLVGGYTAMLSVCLPGFWLHPFGPLTKNLPLLALMLVMWRASPPHPPKPGE